MCGRSGSHFSKPVFMPKRHYQSLFDSWFLIYDYLSLLFFLDLGWAVGHLHENIFCCEYLTPEVKAEKSNVLIFLSCSEWHREEPCATFTYDSYWWVTWWVRENSVYFLDGDLWGSGSAVTSDKLYLGLSLLIRTVPGLMQRKWLFAYVKI